jgi:hypothetical protein
MWRVPIALLLPSIGWGLCSAPRAGETRHEFRLLAGYSPASPTIIGSTEGRRFAMAELSYSYACWQWPATSVSVTAGVIPAAMVRQPDHWVYGFAVMPVGFFAEFARRRKVHPIAEANGGIVASTEPIPIRAPDATGLNFLFNFGGGVRWRAGERSAVTVGYRFLHISNAYTTAFNPGLDNNVIYVSYSVLR